MGSIKLTVYVLLSACCLQRSLPSYCQSVPSITLSETDATLEKVLNDIRVQTGYTYFGEGDWPRLAHHLTFSVKKATIRQVLDICFADQPLTYELKETAVVIQIKEKKEGWVHGFVINENKEPLTGVTVAVRGGGPPEITVTSDKGEFRIRSHYADDRVIISSINYKTREVRPETGEDLLIQLESKVSELIDVSVIGYTGYQEVKQDISTGSYSHVDNELINRRVSPNILDHMDGVTSSVLFNKNVISSINQSAITIRGRSTIFGNPDPLIVVDNFPFTGDISNINPNDVENITVLKDAAAASIWGAFSGNGVIVITTKKGRYGQTPKLALNSSVTVGQKPDLYYRPILSSSDYIDIEQYQFDHGYYDPTIISPQHLALPPAVEIMAAARNGSITNNEAQSQLNDLRVLDTRRDFGKYFYRSSVNSQYSLNLSGGSNQNQYYLAAGYDKDVSNLMRDEYNRISLIGNNTYSLIPQRLEVTTGLAFTTSKTYNNNSGVINITYPYARLADDNSNPLATPFLLRESYVDSLAKVGQLLDWHYRPLDELRNANNTARLTDYRISIGIRYKMWKELSLQANYQYERGDSSARNLQSQQTFYTRNLINSFTQILPGGQISRPIPLGDILDEAVSVSQANNVRLQLHYDDSLFYGGILNVLGGVEVRDVEGDRRFTRLYGYNKDLETNVPIDYTDQFPQYSGLSLARIPYINQKSGTSDRFFSYYFNALYTYHHRYTLSASARRDESNLFGVKANQKGVPLWSVGGAWELSREKFYHLSWLPYLKLRVTNGYNGNVDRSVSAYTTANIGSVLNVYGAPVASIINPPNPNLRWERINIFNTGIDFSTKNKRIGGSIEYYIKSGKDLIGQSPLDPTTGVPTFTGNTANMRAQGVDLTLHTVTTLGPVRWNSDWLFSFVRDEVTHYQQKAGPIFNYLSPTVLNPIMGHPLYSVYALRWMGLDPQNGNPRGLLNKTITTDYNSILNSSDPGNLLYKGPATPHIFGSWRNSFYWKQWGLSFNILYKFSYVFRRNSIFYVDVFNGFDAGSPDYEKRWQKPGDELHTNVPSMVYMTTDHSRDNFYQYSETLIEKGDHIRLQDLQLSYDLTRKSFSHLPLQGIRFYLYADNIGIIWRANRQGIDPDYALPGLIPNPRTLALGIKADF